MKSREIYLVKRPDGLPTADCFELRSVDLPKLNKGAILVKNLWMTVDPYMRGRMDDTESYIPPFALGAPMEGGAIGQVLESRNNDFAVGDIVESMFGWRDYFVADADTLAGDPADSLFNIHKRERLPDLPLESYLGVAGMPGMTAYTGIELIAGAKPGETVFISGAAGAVGSIACQIAKINGCTVIGSAGSDEKTAWLKDTVGADSVFNYKTSTDLDRRLGDCAPQGIDVYFDNVGGDHLAAAIANMNQYGRIALCGMISGYNSGYDAGEGDLFIQLLSKEIRVQGFIVTSHYQHYPEYFKRFRQWAAEGRLKWEETVLDGLENAPVAFLGLFSGLNKGKLLVKLAEPE